MRKIISFIVIVLFLSLGCISEKEQTNGTISDEAITNTTGINGSESGIENTSEEIDFTGNITLNATANITTTINNVTYEENKTTEEKTYEGLTFNGYILVLEDVSLDEPEYCALLKVYDAQTMKGLEQMKVCPGSDYLWTSPNGKHYTIRILKAVAGYSGGAMWADILLFG